MIQLSIENTIGFAKMILKGNQNALFAQSTFSLAHQIYTGLAGSMFSLLNAAKSTFANGLRLPKHLVGFGTDKRSINDIVQTQGIKHEQFECETADGYLLQLHRIKNRHTMNVVYF